MAERGIDLFVERLGSAQFGKKHYKPASETLEEEEKEKKALVTV